MSDDYEEIDLRALDDDELVEQMHDDLYNGLKEEVEQGTRILLERKWGADTVLDRALVGGMQIVGVDFRDGILFVPEVLQAANAMKGGMEILRPLLAETGAEVIDIGINNPVEKYLDALDKHQPDILGMSALLTTTMPYMKVVIDTMKEKG